MIFNFGGEEHKWESKGEKSDLRWRTKEKTRLEVLAYVGNVCICWIRGARACSANICILVKEQTWNRFPVLHSTLNYFLISILYQKILPWSGRAADDWSLFFFPGTTWQNKELQYQPALLMLNLEAESGWQAEPVIQSMKETFLLPEVSRCISQIQRQASRRVHSSLV